MSVSACGVCLSAGAVADSRVLCAGVCQYQPVECVYQRGRWLTVESCVLGYVSISLWSVSISGGRWLTVESCVLGYVSISLWSVSISGGSG